MVIYENVRSDSCILTKENENMKNTYIIIFISYISISMSIVYPDLSEIACYLRDIHFIKPQTTM